MWAEVGRAAAQWQKAAHAQGKQGGRRVEEHSKSGMIHKPIR